jgi:hypothetical protein
MRILITGSRKWDDFDMIREALTEHTSHISDMSTVTLVHGGAVGADSMAGHLAEQMGMVVEKHPANWDSCGPDCNPKHLKPRPGGRSFYCPRSGFVRNDKMVKLGADICLAFSLNASRGTEMCADMAEKSGIMVHRYGINNG